MTGKSEIKKEKPAVMLTEVSISGNVRDSVQKHHGMTIKGEMKKRKNKCHADAGQHPGKYLRSATNSPQSPFFKRMAFNNYWYSFD